MNIKELSIIHNLKGTESLQVICIMDGDENVKYCKHEYCVIEIMSSSSLRGIELTKFFYDSAVYFMLNNHHFDQSLNEISKLYNMPYLYEELIGCKKIKLNKLKSELKFNYSTLDQELVCCVCFQEMLCTIRISCTGECAYLKRNEIFLKIDNDGIFVTYRKENASLLTVVKQGVNMEILTEANQRLINSLSSLNLIINFKEENVSWSINDVNEGTSDFFSNPKFTYKFSKGPESVRPS